MSSARNTQGRIRGYASSIPSILSDNRTFVAVVAFLYLLPLTTTAGLSPMRALLFLITQIMIFGILAMSFDLQLGRAGLLNFGHAALFGLGAYIMAFTLDASILPPPLNLIAAIPYPITLVLAMMVGGGIGFVMGLTTSRMRGTAFAFVALAIAMFIYYSFVENQAISGGETGLPVDTPGILRTAPAYLLFVTIAFVFLAAFLGVVVLYLMKRRESFGLVLITLVMIALTFFLLAFGNNIFGPVLVIIAYFGMVIFHELRRSTTVGDPLQYSEDTQPISGDVKPTGMLTAYILPLSIVVIALIGMVVSFGANIAQMVSLWIEQSGTIYYRIPVEYYLVLTCLVLTYTFMKRLVASPFGRMVAAVAQNEERAEALGYNSYRTKIVVLVISGAIAGLAGGLFAPYLRTIGPEVLDVGVTIDAMLYTIIGGIGTLLGPLFGAGVVAYSELYLVDFVSLGLGLPGELWLVGLGVMYVLIVLFLPMGFVGTFSDRARSFKERIQQLKIGRFEFGIKESDYWILVLLAAIVLFLLLLTLR